MSPRQFSWLLFRVRVALWLLERIDQRHVRLRNKLVNWSVA